MHTCEVFPQRAQHPRPQAEVAILTCLALLHFFAQEVVHLVMKWRRLEISDASHSSLDRSSTLPPPLHWLLAPEYISLQQTFTTRQIAADRFMTYPYSMDITPFQDCVSPRHCKNRHNGDCDGDRRHKASQWAETSRHTAPGLTLASHCTWSPPCLCYTPWPPAHLEQTKAK